MEELPYLPLEILDNIASQSWTTHKEMCNAIPDLARMYLGGKLRKYVMDERFPSYNIIKSGLFIYPNRCYYYDFYYKCNGKIGSIGNMKLHRDNDLPTQIFYEAIPRVDNDVVAELYRQFPQEPEKCIEYYTKGKIVCQTNGINEFIYTGCDDTAHVITSKLCDYYMLPGRFDLLNTNNQEMPSS